MIGAHVKGGKEKERKDSLEIDSLDDFHLKGKSNFILVENHDTNIGKKSEAGIILVTETTSDYDEGEHADRIFIVRKVPKELFFTHNERLHGSLPWKTTIECKVGDEILIKPAAAHNAARFTKDGKDYRLVPYDECICVKRKDKIIPLNGYVICEEVYDETKSSYFSVVNTKVLNPKFGIVKYIGSKVEYQAHEAKQKRLMGYGIPNLNRWSENKVWSDEGVDLKEGDKFVVRRRDIHIRTEGETHARFFDGEMYFITQRKDIIAIIND